jgi:hypothetical protein
MTTAFAACRSVIGFMSLGGISGLGLEAERRVALRTAADHAL